MSIPSASSTPVWHEIPVHSFLPNDLSNDMQPVRQEINSTVESIPITSISAYLEEVSKRIKIVLEKSGIPSHSERSILIYFACHPPLTLSLESISQEKFVSEIKTTAFEYLDRINKQKKIVWNHTRKILNHLFVRRFFSKNSTSDFREKSEKLSGFIFKKIFEEISIVPKVPNFPPLPAPLFYFVTRECDIAALKDHIFVLLQEKYSSKSTDSDLTEFIIRKLLSYLPEILSSYSPFKQVQETLQNENNLKAKIESDLPHAQLSEEVREKVQKILNSPELSIIKDFLKEINNNFNNILWVSTKKQS